MAPKTKVAKSTVASASPSKTERAKAQSTKKKPAAPAKKKPGAAKPRAPAAGRSKPAAGRMEAPAWSAEQLEAGVRIQAHVRGFLARRRCRHEREGRARMQEEMEELRRKAYLAEVQFERRQDEKRRRKQAEKAAKQKKEARMRKEMLEAAFDGDDGELQRLLAEARDVMDDPAEAADAHGNTLLSEASAGGAAPTVRLLLRAGADPNSRGEFKRTPLWRAAFLGKPECAAALLEAGADPRIGNESGELPVHVAAPSVKELLASWDVARTDRLVAEFEAMRLGRAAEKEAEKRQELQTAEGELEDASAAHERAQRELCKARKELERLIVEYDTMVGEGKQQQMLDTVENTIHDQEARVEAVTKAAREAADRLQNARLVFREKKSGQDSEEEELPGLQIDLKELDDVLVKDVGDRIQGSGKWPAVVDVSSQASVFLRYMDTNYVNALNINQTEPNKLRRSLLGSIRYGKPCVIDIMDVDMWDEVVKMFDQVESGLLSRVLDKTILNEEAYLSLVRPADGEEYERNQFQEARIRNFKFVLLTSARMPNQTILDSFYIIRIKLRS